jgi:hypothetical protein
MYMERTLKRTMRPGTNKRISRTGQTLLVAFALMFLSAGYPAYLRAGVQATFLYSLSNFTGPILYSAPRVVSDKDRHEISVLSGNEVRVFNERGMEIYRFGDDLAVGSIADLSVDSKGDILLLAYGPPPESRYAVVRCNFRGEPTGKIEIKNLPSQFSGFSPGRMVSLNNRLYLADLMGLKVVVTDPDGAFKDGYDIFSMLSLKETMREDVEMLGFGVADDGSILFTIPVLFSAYRLYPDKKMASFGRPGSAPGKFNLVRGIALDSRGNYLVVDRLKSTVMVFDGNFKYVTQFGYRGAKRGNLIAPDDVAVDASGKVYVTQNAKRGVNVYTVSY